eukprot:3159423-Prorocentrum_lima.AAC.1
MTSSLVGSEMCIRDSSRTELVRVPPCLALVVHTALSMASAAPPANAKSVSYTHLTLPTICSV